MNNRHKDETELFAALKLAGMTGINNSQKQCLLAHFSRVNQIFEATQQALKSLLDLSFTQIRKSFASVDDDRLAQQLDLLNHHQIEVITHADPIYPDHLKQIDDAPAVLFARGDLNLLAAPQLAIVGSRSASPSGLKTATAFSREFAKTGLCITSGLALGIDTAAHVGAADELGQTLAVVATGLDEVYPKSNIPLAKKIVGTGLMISEFPPMTPARRDHFPRRNRIISGLSLGVLVVEADTRSGSLITARLAGEQGREIFAIPGSIHLPTSRGCHQLIRQGAKLVETTADVLVELKPYLEHALIQTPPSEQQGKNVFDPDTEAVLKLIDFAPTAVEDIATHSNLSIDLVSSILLQLELAGEIAPLAGGQYQRVQAVNVLIV